jgi:hypothetical protein
MEEELDSLARSRRAEAGVEGIGDARGKRHVFPLPIFGQSKEGRFDPPLFDVV